MFSKTFANQGVLLFIGVDDDYQVAANNIVGVKKVGNDAKKTEASSEDDELIFGTKFIEEVLLIFLRCYL